MATRRSGNQTVNYRSISKPKVSPGGFSSFSNSLVSKQQAAEDVAMDNQYANGDISQDYYLSNLATRLARPTLTPAQKVNLQQKYSDVQVKVQDAKVENDYAQGNISTADVLKYNKDKLGTMSASDSQAYQLQQKKVADLQNKFEKESRAQTRIDELKRISTMPEDTDQQLLAKANLMDKLSHQARLDGDNQTADTLETSRNNYQAASKRASINDLITQTRQSVSETLPGGLGVPSAAGGQDIYGKLTGTQTYSGSNAPAGVSAGNNVGIPAGGGSTTGGGAITKSFAVYGNNGAVQNALKSLDATQKSIDRIQQTISDKQELVSKYDQAIGMAEGDQKTTLTIARNNIASELTSLNNSLDIASTSVNDKISQIQDLQQKAAFGNFKKTVSNETNALNLQEKKLESDLKSGKIDKNKYLFESANLTGSRLALLNDTSNGYRQFGEDSTADNIDQQISDISSTRPATIYQTLVQGVANLKDTKQQDKFINDAINKMGGNYEMVRVAKDGTLNNISGKTLKRGDLSLVDVSADKYNGTFNSHYVKDGNTYAQITFPTQIDPVTGQEVTVRDPSKIKGNAPYFIGKDGNPQQVKFVNQSKAGQTPVYTPVSAADFNKVSGKYIPAQQGNNLIYNLKPAASTPFKLNVPQPLQQAADVYNKISNPFGNPIDNAVKIGSTIAKGAGTAFDAVKNVVGGIFGGNKQQQPAANQQGNLPYDIGGTIKKVAANVVPQAYADELKTKGSNPAPTNGVPPETVKNLSDALKEKGIYSPQALAYALATVQHETANTFQPVNEGYYLDKANNLAPGTSGQQIAVKNGYQGGENYYGRGYIQLTGLPNYQKYGRALGVDLVNHPELANDPKIAARILAEYFKQRGTVDLAKQGRFVDARGTVNNDANGKYVADLAKGFMKNINNLQGSVKSAQAYAPKPKLEPTKPNISIAPTTTPSANLRSQTNNNNSNVRSAAAYVPTPTPSYSPRDTNKDGNIGWSESALGSTVNKAAQGVANYFTKPYVPTQPKITSPIPNYNPPVPKPQTGFQQTLNAIGKAAAPVVNPIIKTVQNVASGVGNFLNKLNPFAKH